MPLDGNALDVIAPIEGAGLIAAGEGAVYVTAAAPTQEVDAGTTLSLYRLPAHGGEAELIVLDVGGANELAFDRGSLYWSGFFSPRVEPDMRGFSDPDAGFGTVEGAGGIYQVTPCNK